MKYEKLYEHTESYSMSFLVDLLVLGGIRSLLGEFVGLVVSFDRFFGIGFFFLSDRDFPR